MKTIKFRLTNKEHDALLKVAKSWGYRKIGSYLRSFIAVYYKPEMPSTYFVMLINEQEKSKPK